MASNYLGLKYGRARNWSFSEKFMNENAALVDELCVLTDKMIENGWTITHNKDKYAAMTMVEKNAVTEQLCQLLDKFFDMDVEIYNEWLGSKHTTKECYRKYLFGFNAENTGV